ncbi:hypothetical protein M5D96_011968 [Drosophila gunungcola]|uniref:Uncharacterized protein n=1 Tax=Drosophila gunungcola TaxID=103775 RepID=A0A9P9YEU4_9MUSC|nr:hypothetical protein M5D96_011968 [Drosophila gunungcola]
MADWAKKAEDQEVSKLVDQLNIESDIAFALENKCSNYELAVNKIGNENEPDVPDT